MPTPQHADHAQHDASLIAGHAAGDLVDSARTRAEALLAECSACADLRRDLVAIAAAARSLPAPAALTRDFRLTPEQAASLRRGSWLRSLLRPFSAPGGALRPMAAAFTSLGVAGLFVATMLPALVGTMALGPAERDTATGAGAPGPGGTAGLQNAPAAPAATIDNLFGQASDPDGKAEDGSGEPPRIAVEAGASPAALGGGRQNQSPTAVGPTVSPLVAGSVALVVMGLVLFGLRYAARRVR